MTIPFSVYKKLDRDINTWQFSCTTFNIHDRKLNAKNIPSAKFEAVNIMKETLQRYLKEYGELV